MNPNQTWDDTKWQDFRKWLIGILNISEATITFIKNDGTERVMRCTLDPVVLPKAEIKEDKKPRKKSDTTLAVYDIESNGWRSFVLKSVKSVHLEW